MRGFLTLLILMVSIMDSSSQEFKTDRVQFASGRFYSSDKNTLLKDLDSLFNECVKATVPGLARAIISPHAGYIYSGKTAASAFSTVPAEGQYENIFIIGSTHVMSFGGASVYGSGDYVTPLGKAEVNKEITQLLKEHEEFAYPESFHNNDHNIEVQVPLIQYYFKDAPKIVPIIIGTEDREKLKKMAEILSTWFDPKNLFVISSDFSHYPSYGDAMVIDSLTAEAIMSGNPNTFLRVLNRNSTLKVPNLVTSMCAWTSGLLFLEMVNGNKNLKFHKISYCNSGDSPFGGNEGVVGYNAIGLYETAPYMFQDLVFSEKDKRLLFSIARSSIESMLNDGKTLEIDSSNITAPLKKINGAFVTLKIGGILRGCIGRFTSDEPLYEAVKLSAISSAFEDPRFRELTKQEYEKVEIEITVLGPLKKISDINEIIIGKHGIYIKKGNMAGTMLPQVATENGWNVGEFLSYTSEHKAGIGPDGWKTAEIYIYEGLVLEENR